MYLDEVTESGIHVYSGGLKYALIQEQNMQKRQKKLNSCTGLVRILVKSIYFGKTFWAIIYRSATQGLAKEVTFVTLLCNTQQFGFFIIIM